MNATLNTKHSETCNRAFGRKDSTCPRCLELANGAAPRKGWGWRNKEAELRQLSAIRNHVCDASCGIVCTKFQW